MNTAPKQAAFNPLEFVTEEPSQYFADGKRFVVDCDRMYQAVVAAIASGDVCSTPDEEHYRGKLRRARSLTDGLKDALAECGEREQEIDQDVLVGGTTLEDGSVSGGRTERRKVKVKIPVLPCEQLAADRLAARAIVLETARLWFTNELQHAVGGKIEVRLTRSLRWKLGVNDVVV